MNINEELNYSQENEHQNDLSSSDTGGLPGGERRKAICSIYLLPADVFRD